jgi:hypothetical protein
MVVKVWVMLLPVMEYATIKKCVYVSEGARRYDIYRRMTV